MQVKKNLGVSQSDPDQGVSLRAVSTAKFFQGTEEVSSFKNP